MMRAALGLGMLSCPPPGSAPVVTLLTSLSALWKFDETSGDRANTLAAPSLIESGVTNVYTAAGVYGGAIGLQISADPDYIAQGYLHSGDASAFRLTGGSFEMAFDVLFDSSHIFGGCVLLAKGDGAEYVIYVAGLGASLQFTCCGSAASVFTAEMSQDVWHHIECYYDAATGIMGVSVDGDTFLTADSGVIGGIAGSSANDLTVGTFSGAAYPCWLYLDNLTFWKRLLTTPERATVLAGQYPWGLA